jgi:hypothetical protein
VVKKDGAILNLWAMGVKLIANPQPNQAGFIRRQP